VLVELGNADGNALFGLGLAEPVTLSEGYNEEDFVFGLKPESTSASTEADMRSGGLSLGMGPEGAGKPFGKPVLVLVEVEVTKVEVDVGAVSAVDSFASHFPRLNNAHLARMKKGGLVASLAWVCACTWSGPDMATDDGAGG
jgi:hypothetical protein